MPKRSDIKKVLVIGSGPIVIGQAAEFDYAGAQACRVMKDAGVNVVLCNSNPATIMTDKMLADEIYLEPLTEDSLKRIIIKERPDYGTIVCRCENVSMRSIARRIASFSKRRWKKSVSPLFRRISLIMWRIA